ncbi:MAG TPA: ABC transporter permease subunit [Candidatus Bathyarchaeia archaeon]|nr:ABC transporter permease subunit [Candidatus Bathyarchaeia archaeon]
MDITIIALATLATIGRILLLMLLSVLSGWGLAYLAVKSRGFENVYVPLINVLESIPVIAFLPVVLLIFIEGLGGSLGVEVAVDFLVFDAVSWNIWIGAYQAFKTVPEHLLEVSENYGFSFGRKMWQLYIPHSIPRVTSNLFSSFADAFFYISVSEVFTVGVNTYQTFGIGTLIALFTRQGDIISVYYSLVCIAVGVIGVTMLLTTMSRHSVAKYSVDSTIEIKHLNPLSRRFRAIDVFRSRTRYISRYARRITHPVHRGGFEGEAGAPTPILHILGVIAKSMTFCMGIVVLVYLVYSSLLIAFAVPGDTWRSFLTSTPYLLYSMGADYLRVLAVTFAAFGVAISLGYVLATHHKASLMLAPVVQAISAFPAPAYFPLVFIASYPFFTATLPAAYSTEIYVFMLGFLSCFYYIFFDFWIGVQAIPTQFWEVMRNYELSWRSRMRRIILPGTFPYLVTGLSSTINSAWAGIEIGEFWPNIDGSHSLEVRDGMMKYIGINMANGHVENAAWVSLLFAIIVSIYGIVFTRNLMDLARKKYVVEEGVYAA